MNIFQKLGKLSSSNREYSSVARALESLRISGKPVTVKFQGDSRSYSSRITAFSRDYKVFVLDNVFPSIPADSFQKGRVATISSTDNTRTISLQSVYLEHLVSNQDMGYEMKVTSSLTVDEFEQDFDFGLHHANHSEETTAAQKVVGF